METTEQCTCLKCPDCAGPFDEQENCPYCNGFGYLDRDAECPIYSQSSDARKQLPNPLIYDSRLIYLVEPWNGPVYISDETIAAIDPDRPS